MEFRNVRIVALVLVLLVLCAGGGYYFFQSPKANASAPEGGPPQAMPVTVAIVTPEPVQIWNQYSARLEAVNFAQIRPQVSGTITEVKFEDGQAVQAGDVLYVIDPRPFEAAVNQAKAELNVSKNQSSLTWKELKRAKELIKTNAISKRILDERSSAHSVAAASVKAAEARVDRAQIDLDYAYVKAPIDGRLSRAEIKEGNLVDAGPGAPVLTTIVSTKGIYADFEVDEQSYLKYIRSAARDRAAENNIPVKLMLNDDSYEYKGFIYSFDNQIDVSSGTIRARALFDNEDGTLLPGMFASVKMGTPASQEQILVAEKAIGTDQNRKFVYVVNDQNMVEYREITIGESVDGSRVVQSGLSAGDKVITEGIIRIRPGMPVNPQEQKAQLEPASGEVPSEPNAIEQSE